MRVAARRRRGASTTISRSTWRVTTYCSTSPKWATLATTPGSTLVVVPRVGGGERKHSGRTAASAAVTGGDLLLRARDAEDRAVVGEHAIGVAEPAPEVVAADEAGDERRAGRS